MKHSPIGASSMHRWGNCPGSISLSKGIPTSTSQAAMEGTIAHNVAEEMLAYKLFSIKSIFKDEYTEEMVECAEQYVEMILDDIRELGIRPVLNENVFIETSFDLGEIHPGLYGTSDAAVYSAEHKKLIVYDYKYGRGVAVSPVRNSQLMYYGLGVLLKINKPVKEVELVICQPRCPHVDGYIRRWETTAVDMIEFNAELKEKAVATEAPNAPLTPGDWCRFCPAAGICPALHEKALEVAQTEFKQHEAQPSNLTSEDLHRLSKVLEWLPRLEQYTKSVREFAYNVASRGEYIPGYKLVAKRAVRKWDIPDADIVKRLEEYIEKEEMFEHKLKSPAQMEKALGKENKHLVNEMVLKKSSGTTLVVESDKRKAVSVGPEGDFKKIEK